VTSGEDKKMGCSLRDSSAVGERRPVGPQPYRRCWNRDRRPCKLEERRIWTDGGPDAIQATLLLGRLRKRETVRREGGEHPQPSGKGVGGCFRVITGRGPLPQLEWGLHPPITKSQGMERGGRKPRPNSIQKRPLIERFRQIYKSNGGAEKNSQSTGRSEVLSFSVQTERKNKR